MANYFQIPIKKVDDDKYLVHCNFHLEYLIRGCHAFYINLMLHMQQLDQVQYEQQPEFIELIKKLLGGNEVAEVNSKELSWLKNWVDIIINVVLELETADFKNKQMNRFLKTAENLMAEIKKLETTTKKVHDDNQKHS